MMIVFFFTYFDRKNFYNCILLFYPHLDCNWIIESKIHKIRVDLIGSKSNRANEYLKKLCALMVCTFEAALHIEIR